MLYIFIYYIVIMISYIIYIYLPTSVHVFFAVVLLPFPIQVPPVHSAPVQGHSCSNNGRWFNH